MTKYISLYGGPGIGKSTVAAGLFAKMKIKGHDVELVPEFAKELVWEMNFTTLENQSYVTARQFYMIKRLEGKCEWVITDSPVFLGAAYVTSDYPDCYIETLKWWNDQVETPEFNYLLQRSDDHKFNPNGRRHLEHESVMLDSRIQTLLERHSISYKSFSLDVDRIYADIFQEQPRLL